MKLPRINTSLACWPGMTHLAAIDAAMRNHVSGAGEPLTGPLSIDHVQLVPQGIDVLDESLAHGIVSAWPATRFRLHANVRTRTQRHIYDLSTFVRDLDWFEAAARIHAVLGADVYSAHSGRRGNATLVEMFDNARRCADLFGCHVAVEGQYPAAGEKPDMWLVSTWGEYRQLLDSGLPYALDLSHLNILRHRTGHLEHNLVAELLASAACREVHISDNDGRTDSHQVLAREPWWWPLLRHIQPGAVVFTEGNHARLTTESNQHERH